MFWGEAAAEGDSARCPGDPAQELSLLGVESLWERQKGKLDKAEPAQGELELGCTAIQPRADLGNRRGFPG